MKNSLLWPALCAVAGLMVLLLFPTATVWSWRSGESSLGGTLLIVGIIWLLLTWGRRFRP